ncbi:MAG: hypothetical protein WBE34_16880 [Candidatus Nitrosopolaris sp.]
MGCPASYGEKITAESWLMRDIWQTTNVKYGAKWGLATAPKRLNSSGIKRMIERALWEQSTKKTRIQSRPWFSQVLQVSCGAGHEANKC